MGSVKTEVFVLFVTLVIELSNWSIMEHCEIKIKQCTFKGKTLFLPIITINVYITNINNTPLVSSNSSYQCYEEIGNALSVQNTFLW